jgi:hypothetical protein
MQAEATQERTPPPWALDLAHELKTPPEKSAQGLHALAAAMKADLAEASRELCSGPMLDGQDENTETSSRSLQPTLVP